MISRRHRLAGLAAAVGLLTVSCEKVPLLAPSSASITLTALATSLPINGTTDLIVQVLEQAGTPPHSGTHVTFITTLGSVQPSEAETDLNGRVVVKFLAGTASGTATITASSGGAGSSGGSTSSTTTATTDSRSVKIAIGAAAVGRIAVTANPGTVPASGGNSVIVASVADANGNPLPSVPVTFTTDAGSFSAAVVNTDQNGNAQTILTTNKTAKVTAAAGLGTSGTGATATGVAPATVTVNVNVVSTIKIETPSPTSPVVGQPVTFPITYTQNTAGSPVQRIVVDWGDGSSAQTFQGSPTAVSHAYSVAGTFAVHVTAFDSFGDFASGSQSVTVGARPRPTISISSSANPTAGTATTFTITAQPAAGSNTVIQDVTVDFGDGTPAVNLGAVSGTSTAQHVYQAGGTYTVTATATDSNGGTASAATVIVVTDQQPLSVSITFTQSLAGANTIVNFTATAAPTTAVIANYLWTFGDGTTSPLLTANQTNHTYMTSSGSSRPVTVTVTTTQGKTATGSTVVSGVQ